MKLFESKDFVRASTVESVEAYQSIPRSMFIDYGNGVMDCGFNERVGEIFIRADEIESFEDMMQGQHLPDCELEEVALVKVRTKSGAEHLIIVFDSDIGNINLDDYSFS